MALTTYAELQSAVAAWLMRDDLTHKRPGRFQPGLGFVLQQAFACELGNTPADAHRFRPVGRSELSACAAIVWNSISRLDYRASQ